MLAVLATRCALAVAAAAIATVSSPLVARRPVLLRPPGRTAGTLARQAEKSLAELTVVKLKDLCREHELPISGRKADLIARLQHAAGLADAQVPVAKKVPAAPKVADRKPDEIENAADLSGLSVVKLKELCREAGVPVSGKKADLIARLKATADDLSKTEEGDRERAAPKPKAKAKALKKATKTISPKKKDCVRELLLAR